MKYVRTKDFIAISELNEEGIHYCSVYENLQLRNLGLGYGTFQRIKDNQTILNGTYYMMPSREVIKESDTPEELCDFVETQWGNHFEIYDLSVEKLPLDILLRDLKFGYLKTLKYGIRTDRGLIYVGEVNTEGKLELWKD